MIIKEVLSEKDESDFLDLPVKLYESNSYWIRPLDEDIRAVFDKKKNGLFINGECIRWLLVDEKKYIGRIAAFLDYSTCDKGANEQPTGGIGFFECINDKKAAFLLFDTCKHWLQSKGMEAMDGPVNFGNRDRWWGLLVEGFSMAPNYQCNYNFPYYRDFFEAYGFRVYFKQFTFFRKTTHPLSKKIIDRAALFVGNSDYSIRHLRRSEMPKLAEYIKTVYNGAWSNRPESPLLSSKQTEHIVAQMKPIIDVKLLIFAFHKGNPVAFNIAIPEINQITQHVNGKMDWKGKLACLWHLKIRKTNRKALGILFGVLPEYQGKGLDGAMVSVLHDLFKKNNRYDDYEMNWIGDFNILMIAMAKRQLEMSLCKVHHTYRKLFDESKTFKRYRAKN